MSQPFAVRRLLLLAARDHDLNLGVVADYEGNERPYGNGPDMGFDELVGYAQIYLPLVVR